MYRHKLEYVLNTPFVSFYYSSGLIFKGWEDMATKGIENWPLSTTLLLIYAFLYENPSEYSHKLYTARN